MPPAAHQRASTGHAGHPVVVSTAACGRRLGGGPAPDGLFTGLIRAPERTGDTSPRHIPRPTSLRANHCVPSSVPACASLPGHGWPTPSSAVILLITGAISLLGPTSQRSAAGGLAVADDERVGRPSPNEDLRSGERRVRETLAEQAGQVVVRLVRRNQLRTSRRRFCAGAGAPWRPGRR